MYKGSRLAVVVVPFASSVVFAQNGYFADWLARADKLRTNNRTG